MKSLFKTRLLQLKPQLKIELACLSWISAHLFQIIVLLPLLLAAIYFLLFAQDRYISTAQVSVRNTDSSIVDNSLGAGLLMATLGAGASTEDAFYLKNYIESPNMLSVLDKELDLRKAFQHSGLDLINSLPWRNSWEALLEYYTKRIHLFYEDKSGLLRIETEGFTPEFALRFNQAVLKESERFINELSHKIIREQMAFAEQQVYAAYAKLNKSKLAVIEYQNKHGVLDPLAEAESMSKMVAELEEKKAELEIQLNKELAFLKENTPQITSTRNLLNALNKQITREKEKIAAPQGEQLNQQASQFQLLKSQLDFNTALYSSALTAAEKSRIEASRKIKVLSIIIKPELAQEASYPKQFYLLLSLLVISLLLFGIIKLIIAVIEDHQD